MAVKRKYYLLSLLSALVFLFLFFRFGLNILRDKLEPMDFAIFYSSFKAVLSGENMYSPAISPGCVFKYAPFFAVIFSPLGFLSLTKAGFLWSVINSLAFGAGLGVFYFVRIKFIKPVHYIFLSLLSLAFIFRALSAEMQVGNSNLLILGLFLLFVFFYLKGRITLAALFFTLMAFIKLSPLLLLLYFLKKRDIKFLLSFGLFGFILVILPPFILTFSFSQTVLTFKTWFENILAPLPQNIIHLQSLKFLLMRYLTDTDIYGLNFLSLSLKTVSYIYVILSAVLTGLALFYKQLKDAQPEGKKEVLLIDINLLFMLSVMLSPANSYQNYAHLFSPVLILFLLTFKYRHNFTWFFRSSFFIVVISGLFTHNKLWKMLGIKNVEGSFPFLAFAVWPIISLLLFFLLYILRAKVIKINCQVV